jgi:hypothetical protein
MRLQPQRVFTGTITAIRLLAVAALSAFVVAGCGGSGYTYHANRDENVYFKVPDDWTVFDTEDYPEGGFPEGLWLRGFMAGSAPSADEVFSWLSDEPRGYVVIEPLTLTERDSTSIATLRGAHFGTDDTGSPIDPFTYAEEHPDELQILGYEDDIVYDHGPHGVHLRMAVSPPGAQETAIVDQTALVDAATRKRYVLSIGCNLDCFDEHERTIEEVIESWTLEEI